MIEHLLSSTKMEFESPLHRKSLKLKTDSNKRYSRTTFSITEFLPGEFMKQVLSVMDKKENGIFKNTQNHSLCLEIFNDNIYQQEGEKITIRYDGGEDNIILF